MRYDMRFRVRARSHEEANLMFESAVAALVQPAIIGCTLIALHPEQPDSEEFPEVEIPIKDRGKL